MQPGIALALEQLLDLRFAEILRNRDRKRDHEARITALARPRLKLREDRLRRVAPHRPSAAAAMQRRGARVEELQVIVQLRHRADGGARSAHRVGLVDRDRRRDALDRVHLRLVHAIEELACVRAEGLDVAPLALRVQRVEDERGLARAGDPGDDDQLPGRERKRQVLEVVLARAANSNRVGGGLLGFHGDGMARRGAILSSRDPLMAGCRSSPTVAGRRSRSNHRGLRARRRADLPCQP